MFMFKKKKKSRSSTSSSTQTQQRSSHELPLSEIEKATNNFDEKLVIGRGTFSDVYKGEVFYKETHVLAAIKRLKDDADRGAPASWPQVEKLSTFSHRNLASLIGYNVKDVSRPPPPNIDPIRELEVILVYEYVPNGTLKDHLHVYRTPISWIMRLNICLDVARGLHYLHTRIPTTGNDVTPLHGDIKSSNILLTESWTAKVSDYGLSKVGPEDGPRDTNYIPLAYGSLAYYDYYTLGSSRLTRKSDVYSFGILLLEILCRRVVIDMNVDGIGRNLKEWVLYCVNEGKIEDIVDPDIRNEVSLENLKAFFDIAESCLAKLPDPRPEIAEIVTRLESVLGDPSNREPRNPNVVPQSLLPGVKEFEFDDLEKATRRFSGRLILDDRGCLDKVFLGWVDPNTLAPSERAFGTTVAVKQFTSEIPQPYNEWLEEVNLLGQLDHPNIIRLLGCCNKDEHEHFLVYEHMSRSLSQYIHGDELLSWRRRLGIMIGVARGLKYLYTTKGLLCHFQCSDILLDGGFNAKIGGFGWAEIHRRHDRKRLNGAFGYLKGVDHYISLGRSLIKNDVFCFGLVLLETLTGRRLSDFDDVFVGLGSLEMQTPNSESNKRKLKEVMDPHLKDGYSLEAAFKCMELASRCISTQAECRPSRGEIEWSLEQIYDL